MGIVVADEEDTVVEEEETAITEGTTTVVVQGKHKRLYPDSVFDRLRSLVISLGDSEMQTRSICSNGEVRGVHGA